MASLRSGINGLVALLLAVVFLAAGVGAWADHGCCGHPSESGRAEGPETDDSDTGASPPDGDCIYACCQTYTAVSPFLHIAFALAPRWFVAGTDEFAPSHVETDIYRPPIA